MALPIKWSKEATNTYQDVIEYLAENWTEKEVKGFIHRTNFVLKLIAVHPYIYQASKHKNIRKALIGKQNSFFYLIRASNIYLLSFWDNRRDPDKNKY
jgi:plasmid stabilization system protein ParE